MRGERIGRYAAAAALAAVPLVVGCGSSGGSGGSASAGSTSAGSTSPSPTASSPAAATSEAPLRAANYVLTPGPALAGFSAKPADPSDDDDPTDKKIDACIDRATGGGPDATGTATADSDDFTLTQTGEYVSSEADVYPAAKVTKDVAQVEGGGYAASINHCLDTVLGPQHRANLGADGVATFGRLVVLPAPAAPDVIAAFRLPATIVASGQKLPLQNDFVLQARGRVESTVFVQEQNGTTPDPTLERALAVQVAARLARQ